MTGVQLVLLPKVIPTGACSMCHRVFAASDLAFIYGQRGEKACPRCHRQAREIVDSIRGALATYGWPRRPSPSKVKRAKGASLTHEEIVALDRGPSTSSFTWRESFQAREWERQAVQAAERAAAAERCQHASQA